MVTPHEWKIRLLRRLMAIVLRGKLKGSKVKINQWCNNWVTGTLSNNRPKVFSLTSLKFTPNEFKRILTTKNNGPLFSLFRPDRENLVFVRYKRLAYSYGTWSLNLREQHVWNATEFLYILWVIIIYVKSVGDRIILYLGTLRGFLYKKLCTGYPQVLTSYPQEIHRIVSQVIFFRYTPSYDILITNLWTSY